MSIDRFARIVVLRFRSLFRRDEVEHELDEELQDHVERQTSENMRQGMPADAARAAALRALGSIAYRKDEVRDTRGIRWIDDLSSDMRFALRSLRRARGFSTAVVLTLALGIGANTAMFTLLRGTVLRPLPNRDGDRLVYLRQAARAVGTKNALFSVPEVNDFRSASSLSAVAEYSSVLPFSLVGKDGQTLRVRTAVVTGNYFDVLGLRPVLGRLTTTKDDGAEAAPVAVLSYEYWMEHFGGDPRVVGTTVRLNDRLTPIVGVVEPAPKYPHADDIYVNTVTSPHHLSATMVTERTHRMSELFARLAPNVTVEQARTELTGVAQNMFKDHPEVYAKAAQWDLTVSPLRDAMNERSALMFWLLMGAAAFVLVIACANVANLTLMRGVTREREMLVRAALGAGRGRLRRLLLVENLTLSLIGAGIGVIVALAGLKLLVAFAAQFSPRAEEIRLDGVVLAVSLITSLAAAAALSFVPRIGGHRALAESLAPTAGGRRMTLGRGRQRFQQSLVVAQIVVCMILLTGAGLLGRTLVNLLAVETGVRADHVLTVELPLGGDLIKEIRKQPENLARYERIRDRVAALPGVQIAAIGAAPPLKNSVFDMDVKAENRPIETGKVTPHLAVRSIDPAYLAAAGIPLIAGRSFGSTDRAGGEKVVILNQAAARKLFGEDNPIGQRVAFTGAVLKFTPFTDAWRTVVGIAGDTRDDGVDSDPVATLYQPFAQEVIVNGSLVVRTTADPAVVQPMVLRAIHAVAPTQLIEKVRTVEQIRDEAVSPRRLNAIFIAAFGGLAFAIAMVGIAAVLAFSVSARTAEIGIRMSLGADAQRVRRMILGEGGVLLVVGVAIGVIGSLITSRALSGLLFGITPHDPATIGAVSVVLAGVGILACWLPAARAARVDPAVALRAE
ncbi:MAG TPA: ABC transporter permease [Gemmatimonadaceae bacterium]